MEMLNTIEAAELLGMSKVRVTQVLSPDKRVKRQGVGGTPLSFYKRSTILAYKDKRDAAAAAKRAARIKKELAVPRPSAKHLTLTEAAEFLNCPKGVIVHNVPAKIIYKDTRPHRFYTKADLLNMPPDAKSRPKGEAGRTTDLYCESCGRPFRGHLGKDTRCRKCRTGQRDMINDPYGVIRPRKRQRRKCPICGRQNLFEGQYTCSECKSKRNQPNHDEEFTYICV